MNGFKMRNNIILSRNMQNCLTICSVCVKAFDVLAHFFLMKQKYLKTYEFNCEAKRLGYCSKTLHVKKLKYRCLRNGNKSYFL